MIPFDEIRLWRLLQTAEPDPALLKRLLGTLASAPFAERYPFFGFLPGLVEHPDSEVRARAYRVLAGAQGFSAYRLLVEGLRDPVPAVKKAAVVSLRVSAKADPGRWAHVLFHPDPQVRQCAVGGEPVPGAEWMEIFLLDDPPCAPQVLARMQRRGLGPEAVSTALDFTRKGRLPVQVARELVCQVPWEKLLVAARNLPARDPDSVSRILHWAAEADGPERMRQDDSRDFLDDVLWLFWDRGEDGGEGRTTVDEFFRKVSRWLVRAPGEEGRRTVCSLLVNAVRQGGWTSPAAEACALGFPEFLRFSWVPAGVRKKAVQALYRESCKPVAREDTVGELLRSDLCRRAGGTLDLRMVGGLLSLTRREPYGCLLQHHSFASILEAFAAAPGESASLFHLCARARGSGLLLIDKLAESGRFRPAFIKALLVHAAPEDMLDFLDRAGAGEVVEILEELRTLAMRSELELSLEKHHFLVEKLGGRIDADVLPRFLRQWLKWPAPGECVLDRDAMLQVTSRLSAGRVVQAVLSLGVEAVERFAELVVHFPRFPYDLEQRLGERLIDREDGRLRRAGRALLASATGSAIPARTYSGKVIPMFSAAGRCDLAFCPDEKLERVLEASRRTPVYGLCAPLARRPSPDAPSVRVCLALLACHDSPWEVAREFGRFGAEDSRFLRRLDREMGAGWGGEENLPLWGHAWLCRWEAHCRAFGEGVEGWSGGFIEVLRLSRMLGNRPLADRLWEAVERLLEMWRREAPEKVHRAVTEEAVEMLVRVLPTEVGLRAARILAGLHEDESFREMLVDLAAVVAGAADEVAEEVAQALSPWLGSGQGRAAWRERSAKADPSAIERLLEGRRPSPRDREKVLAFLAADDGEADLRVRAAGWLLGHGVADGLPLLMRDLDSCPEDLWAGAPPALVEKCVLSVLLAGEQAIEEGNRKALEFLQFSRVRQEARERGYRCLLQHGECAPTLIRTGTGMRRGGAYFARLRRLAEACAWGIRRGEELTGKRFEVSLCGGDEMGFTAMSAERIWINPLPLLRGERRGDDIVRGLILHELGHHRYHGGEGEQVRDMVGGSGLEELLNLVLDEHLERNLRAVSRDWGDKLKRLAAYAFQHARREMPVEYLLKSLRGRSFAALVGGRLEVARRSGCVKVGSGWVLLELERSGSSFARFVRALRMGLGNRSRDGRVAEGLALFSGEFRQGSLFAALEIARRLREIFGDECRLLGKMSQDELWRSDAAELASAGQGLTAGELQAVIRRLLEDQRGTGEEAPGRHLNLDGEEGFEQIARVERLSWVPREHAKYCQDVAPQARVLRRYLRGLGLDAEKERYRVSGRRLDRARLPAALLHGDPRFLCRQQPVRRTELFVGVVIDCSGSMDLDRNIEKAKRFGMVLAEGARDVRGIDVRFFGFTDSVIYDLGDARRCAIHALQADGGNNDAAALWHAALVARRTRQKKRLLVMISDGSPTECSVAALRALVGRLTRGGDFCCAQVAVRPMEEICFPHHVIIDDSSMETAVHRFGETIVQLAGQTMRSG